MKPTQKKLTPDITDPDSPPDNSFEQSSSIVCENCEAFIWKYVA